MGGYGGIVCQIEYSSDLSEWEPAPAEWLGSEEESGRILWSVEVPLDHARGFLRLRVLPL